MDTEIRELIKKSILREPGIRAFGTEAVNRLLAMQENFEKQQVQPGIAFQLFL